MKKVISMSLAFLTLSAFLFSFTALAEIEEKPELKISYFNTIVDNIKAGDEFKISFVLCNVGNKSAENVTVGISNYDSNTFTPVGLETVKNISYISRYFGEQTVTFNVNTNSSMKTGSYPLTFTYNYPGGSGTYTTYINIVNENSDEQSDPSVTIGGFTSPASTVTAGKEFDLSFSMINNGGQTAKDVSVSIANLSTETFIPTKLETVEKVGDIASKKTVNKTIRLKTSENLKTGSHPLEISYTYITGDGTVVNGKYTTYISIYNATKPEDTDEGSKSTPRIILDNYSVDADSIVAGKPFNFSFTLKNTSTSTAVGNMKVTIESADGIFTAVEGSSSFYTQSLGSGQTTSYSIDLLPKGGVEAKSYPLKLQIDYEDSKGSPYSSSETINLQVTQPIRFEVSNLNYPPMSYGFNPCFISFRYYNKSKTALSNFSITVEGDFMLETGEEYIGALAANSYDEYEGMLYPNGTGMLNGVLVFKYEDASGNEQRIEEPFTIEIMEEDPYIPSDGDIIIDPDKPFDPGFEGDKDSSGMPGWVIAVIAVAAVGVVVTVVIVIVKKKKNKQNEDLDDEE